MVANYLINMKIYDFLQIKYNNWGISLVWKKYNFVNKDNRIVENFKKRQALICQPVLLVENINR